MTGAYKNPLLMVIGLGICICLFAWGICSDESKASFTNLGLILKRDNIELVKFASSALEKNWQNLIVFTSGATAALQMNEIDKAEAFANQAFKIKPDDAHTALVMFLVKAERNLFDDAEIWAQKVLMKDPKLKSVVYLRKYNMYHASDNLEKAVEALETLEKMDDKFVSPHWLCMSRVSMLIATKKPEEALALSRKNHDEWFFKLSPEESALLDQSLAEAMIANQMWLAAAEAHTRAYENSPNCFSSLVHRAGCYIMIGELDQARADLDEFDLSNRDENLKNLSAIFREQLPD
ncbi:MAG: hypothetical protein KIT34_05390 [Cyanobacteria bacterium TGS_CYA1]|nr:hypothetical protein [Cyanobacteria bacterium TGS_CYA1]